MNNNKVIYKQQIKYNIKPSKLEEHKTYWNGRGVKIEEDRYLPSGLLRIKLKSKVQI